MSYIFFQIIYEAGLILLWTALLPKFLYQLIVKKKYRKSFLQRFGKGFPSIRKDNHPLIWIHAVSLGETKAVCSLAKMLKNGDYSPTLIFSTATETGYSEACRTIGADYCVYLPFDFGWIIKPLIKRLKPDLVVLCESDFWYNFLSSAKQAGATVAVVNGKLSMRSTERFCRFPFFSNKLFHSIDLFCVQSSLYAKRFERIGIPTQKISVTGNMKFDGDYTRLSHLELTSWRSELGIAETDPVIVIGSSHHPEESELITALSKAWQAHPNLKVLIVPRHPERFNEVAGVLQKFNLDFHRLSQKLLKTSAPPIILVDAMGLLRKCYQLATLAIVAGSYTQNVGGHNILEPACFGIPVIFGPHMYSQPDLVHLILEYKAGFQTPLDQISSTVLQLLNNNEQRRILGEAGLNLAKDLKGATQKTFDYLKCNLSG